MHPKKFQRNNLKIIKALISLPRHMLINGVMSRVFYFLEVADESGTNKRFILADCGILATTNSSLKPKAIGECPGANLLSGYRETEGNTHRMLHKPTPGYLFFNV